MLFINNMLLLIFIFGVANAALPSYIVPCQNGPKLVECSIKNGNAAIPHLIKGNPKYKLPVLDPLIIKELSTTENSAKNIALNFTLIDIKIEGLKNGKMVNAVMDPKNNHMEWYSIIPEIAIHGKYKISGKFLILPITGSGNTELILENVRLNYTIDYKKVNVKGKTMAQLSKTKLLYDTTKLRMKFENLFNGDKNLGDHMNAVLNENWKEFNSQLGPSIIEGINQVFNVLMNTLIKDVPFSDIIKD